MNSANKIVFLGDCGVGKSTFINTLCGAENSRPQSTLGCSIQILPHQYAAGTPDESTELLELWDIGGSNAHREASRVFLDSTSGIIFVHDLSNARSADNLSLWHDLFYNRHIGKPNSSFHRLLSNNDSLGSTTSFSDDVEGLGSIPTLVVGTRLDQCPGRNNTKAEQFQSTSTLFLKQYEHVSVDARKLISPGSTNRLLFSRFFDATIEKSQAIDKRSYSIGVQSRRRKFL